MPDDGKKHCTPEDYSARRTMLLAAIADTEGTIQGTDTKASIALVIHGLVLSAILGVAGGLSGFDDSAFLYRAWIVLLLAVIVAVFLFSVAQLLRCVMPTPAKVFSGIEGGHDVFFISAKVNPRTGRMEGIPSPKDIHSTLVTLDQGELEEDLVVELTVVSTVRARKVALVGDGLKWLALEIALSTVFVVSVGLHALG